MGVPLATAGVLQTAVASVDSFTEATLGATSVPVKTLDAQHDYYTTFVATWQKLDILYQGGRVMEMFAAQFLKKRPKEINDVFTARLEHFTYQNVLGVGIGYFLAKLFQEDPSIDVKLSGENLKEPAPGDEINLSDPADAAWDFYVEYFLKDCDAGSTSFVDVFRNVLRTLLLYKRAFILIDLPKGTQSAVSLADQNLRPRLQLYEPVSAINWDRDSSGNLNWIVFKVETKEREFLKKPRDVKYWYYFDRKQFFTYQWRASDDPKAANAEPSALLIDSGPHSMADYKDDQTGQITGRVPVEIVEVPDDQWIANRVYLPVKDHLNIDNSLAWGLFMANMAMPVIISDTDYQPTLTECGFIQLGMGSKFEWAEPSGTSFKASQDRIDKLREEIFRLMHLAAQGRSNSATPAAQSGFSKELDMAPSKDVLRSLGDLMRSTMQTVLYLVAAVRGDKNMDFDVRGLDFDDSEIMPEIEAASAMQTMGIRSQTFANELEKQLVSRYCRDWNPETVTKIQSEIDAAPTQDELDQQNMDAENQQLKLKIQAAGASLTAKTLTHSQATD